MDGVLTNPFAHAVATALRVDGSNLVEDVLSVEADLFRANDISSDDTSTVRVRTRRGTTMLLAATLCSPDRRRARDHRRRKPGNRGAVVHQGPDPDRPGGRSGAADGRTGRRSTAAATCWRT